MGRYTVIKSLSDIYNLYSTKKTIPVDIEATKRIWHHMKQRCFNKKSGHYRHYGARGITVCDRWKDSFDNFYEDMGSRPYKMQLDRINNDGNYEPGNCRWATPKENGNNKRKYLVKCSLRFDDVKKLYFVEIQNNQMGVYIQVSNESYQDVITEMAKKMNEVVGNLYA